MADVPSHQLLKQITELEGGGGGHKGGGASGGGKGGAVDGKLTLFRLTWSRCVPGSTVYIMSCMCIYKCSCDIIVHDLWVL